MTGEGDRTAVDALVIRAAEVSDAGEIAALANMPAFRPGTLRPPFQSIGATRRWLESLPQGNVSVVAVLGTMLVGSAGLGREAGRRAHVAGLGTGVHDDHCGRGIATAVLSALVDAADHWIGLRRIELLVCFDNEAAIRRHERAGFEREGILKGSAVGDGRYVDCIAMARLSRSLGPLVPTAPS